MKSPDDGFTLVELLVVILVLAVLGGITILSVSGTRDHAVDACEKANTRVDATRDGVAAVRGGSRPELVAGGSC